MTLSEWQDDIDKLRAVVGDVMPASYDNSYNLYRWVKAWNGDVNEILPLFREHMELREAMGMDEAGFGTTAPDSMEAKVDAALKSGIGISELRPDVTDRDGNLINVMKLGKVNIRELQENVKCSDYLLFNLKIAEMVRRQLLAAEERSGKPIGLTVIYDLEGIALSKAVVDAIQGGMGSGLKLVQAHFPELTKRLIVVNVPTAVDYIWNVIKMFLAERTRKKVIFLGADWRNQILNYVNIEHLPVEYSGTSSVEYEEPKPFTTVTEPLYEVPEVAALNTVYIKPRESFAAETEIILPGINLKWTFRANGELIFGIQRKRAKGESWKAVIPTLPLNSKLHIEFGSVKCDGDTTYRIIVQNTAGYLLSTKFDYWIVVQHPDGKEYPLEVIKIW